MKDILLSLALCLGLVVCAFASDAPSNASDRCVRSFSVTRTVQAERPVKWIAPVRPRDEKCDGDNCKQSKLPRLKDRGDKTDAVPDCLKKKSIIDNAVSTQVESSAGLGVFAWIGFGVIAVTGLAIGVAIQWYRTYHGKS